MPILDTAEGSLMIASLALLAVLVSAPADPLLDGFRRPSYAARPHTWWHWMNGNATKEGITADLEDMKEVGLAGAQLFTVDQEIPPGPAGYMGPKWRELTAFAVKEAHRLGIELCLHNCAGWSSSGGPWIRPEDSMQVLAWAEIRVSGPRTVTEKLPAIKPPRVEAKVDWSRDIAVFAFPTHVAGAEPSDAMQGRTGVVRADGIRPDLKDYPGIDPATILDLTSSMDEEGCLRWQAPEGDWTILRMGAVSTGKTNHPAPPEGTGLEVDKLSREAMDKHWNSIVAKVLSDAGPLAGKTLNNALIDSYEVGGQNWTPKFRQEFRRRRGYDPLKWMPAIAGFMVDRREKSERFLWDYRRTIADLYADNYFGRFKELCARAGMKMSVEPYGNGGFDNIQAGLKADVPMGEFWVNGAAMESVKLAASVGHIMGSPIVGAESFTADEGSGRWSEDPYRLKTVGDRAFAQGMTRVIFHRFAHQPWLDVQPGMTMGPWGTHFDRTQTWWKEAKEWVNYLSRCQHMLQQGSFVADIAHFYGEDAPSDLPGRSSLRPAPPHGYDYDGIDASTLKTMSVKNGRLVLPSGMSYSVLALPDTQFMTPWVALKVRDLLEAGAAVYGPKPLHSPSLVAYPASEFELKAISDQVWGDGREGVRKVGMGRLASGGDFSARLKELGVQPDLEVVRGSTASIAWIHRRVKDADIYFISNQTYRRIQPSLNLRTQGKKVELWDPVSARTQEAPSWFAIDGRTQVNLDLSPAQSVFLVLRYPGKPHKVSGFIRAEENEGNAVPHISVTRAWYGSADGRGVDVTAKVQELVSSGQTFVPATNALFGDPAYLSVKKLTLEFTLNGKPMKVVADENTDADLLPQEAGSAAAFDQVRLPNGLPEVTSWVKGTYEIFQKGTLGTAKFMVPAPYEIPLSTDWNLAYQPNRGAPKNAEFSRLISWTDHPDKGIKYFSGTATYAKKLSVSKEFCAKGRVVRLDLGQVKNFATVTLNGRQLGVCWMPPFTIDVTSAIKPGENTLVIKVTNLWVNRLIGDEFLPAEVEWKGRNMESWPAWLKPGEPRIAAKRPKTGRITFATWRHYSQDSPLLPSGLIGPVRLQSAKPIVGLASGS
mgnify:CR=1 FL=1